MLQAPKVNVLKLNLSLRVETLDHLAWGWFPNLNGVPSWAAGLTWPSGGGGCTEGRVFWYAGVDSATDALQRSSFGQGCPTSSELKA